MSESNSCPSCGRNRDQATGSTRLMIIAKKTAEKGSALSEEEASKARKGAASKDAHAVIPQTFLRPAAQMLVVKFLMQNGISPGASPEDTMRVLTEHSKDLKEFYKSQMTEMTMRPLAPEHDEQFEDAKRSADLKIDDEVPGKMQELEDLLAKNGLEDCEKVVKGSELEALFDKVNKNPIVQRAKPKNVSVAEAQESRENIVTSSKLTDSQVARPDEACHDAPSEEEKPAHTSPIATSTESNSTSHEPSGFRKGSLAQEGMLDLISSNKQNKSLKSEIVFGTIVKATYSSGDTSEEKQPDEFVQYIDRDGTILSWDKMISGKGTPVSVMSHSDLKKLEGHLRGSESQDWASKVFQGIMGAPFTAGTQCGYCESVQGEFTLPERVRIARDRKLKDPLRKAFVSADLEAKIIDKADLTEKVKTLDEIESNEVFERALQNYMQDWLDPVADELVRRIPDIFGERVADPTKDEQILVKLYGELDTLIQDFREDLKKVPRKQRTKKTAVKNFADESIRDETDELCKAILKEADEMPKQDKTKTITTSYKKVQQKKKAIDSKQRSMKQPAKSRDKSSSTDDPKDC